MDKTRPDMYAQDDEEQVAKDTLRSERTLLGAVILDNSLMRYATEHLIPTSFSITKHRSIFTAMIELNKREAPISVESIVNELRSQGALDAVGGEEYVTSIVKGVPFALTTEQPDHVDRFILGAIATAMSAAALSGNYSPNEVAGLFFEKTQKLKELRGWRETPLLKKPHPLLEVDEGKID